jgi:hypothetical protein
VTTATCPFESIASRACRREADISFLTRILFAAYFLEAGLILVVAPWSGFWDRNLFFASLPTIAPLLETPFARGAVSGIGVITVVAGLAEVAGVLSLRHRNQDLGARS